MSLRSITVRYAAALVLGLGLAVSRPTRASTVEVIASLRWSPVVLTGTLRPATLSANGRPLSIKSRGAKALLLNGEAVATRGDLGSFHLVSETPRIELSWEWPDEAGREAIGALQYPSVRSLRISPSQAEIVVDDRTQAVTVDGADAPLEGRSAVVPIGVDGAWLDADHAIELRGSDGGGRVYSLSLGSFKDDVLSDWSVGAAFQSPANGSGNGYAVSIRRALPSRLSLEAVAGLSFYSHSFTDSNSTSGGSWTFHRNGYELKIRAGYNPFLSGQGIIDPRRLTLGLTAMAFLDHTTASTSTNNQFYPESGSNTVYAQLDFMVRLELLQYKSFGLVFYNDFFLIRALRSYDYANTSGGMGLAYHW